MLSHWTRDRGRGERLPLESFEDRDELGYEDMARFRAAVETEVSSAEVARRVEAAKQEMREEIRAQLATQSLATDWQEEWVEEKRKLIEDPSKIEVAVEEMIRMVSPIQNMNRTLTRDTELHDVKLREGDRVLLLYPAANRDERAFERPDEFDVERWPNRHVAFGGYGVHHCLGASLARLELKKYR